MGCGGISLMTAKPVLWISAVVILHEAIALDLRENSRGCHRDTIGISLDLKINF
jgi:hypothetical protein